MLFRSILFSILQHNMKLNQIRTFIKLQQMLNQQIQIQPSLSNQNSRLSQINLRAHQMKNSMFQTLSLIDNCTGKRQLNQQKTFYCDSICIQIQHEKLLQLYNEGLEKLNHFKSENQALQKQKKYRKNMLQEQLKQLTQNQQQKNLKFSQKSTAGEDAQKQNRLYLNKPQNLQNSIQKISALEQKLKILQNGNSKTNQEQKVRIQQLKQMISIKQNLTEIQPNAQKIKMQTRESSYLLASQTKLLQQKKQNLLFGNNDLKQKITAIQKQTLCFSNNIEYLIYTQNCCQYILDQELCNLQYKIEGKTIQYDSHKKYLDRITRTRKNEQNEQNESYVQMQKQIQYLNDCCEQMMTKKNSCYGPQIKKYKYKRLATTEQIQDLKSKSSTTQTKNKQIMDRTKELTKTHDQLQDQYLVLSQKLELKTQGKAGYISSQDQVKFLRQKKLSLIQQVKRLISQYQNVKSQIQKNKSLVPQNILRDLQNKIRQKKQQVMKVQVITIQNKSLEEQNKHLGETKYTLQWKANPQFEKVAREQKQLIQGQNQTIKSVQVLKEINQSIEYKVGQMREFQQYKNQEVEARNKLEKVKKQNYQEQRLRKQAQKRVIQDREKLVQRFRQSKQNKQREEQVQNRQQKLNQIEKQRRKGSGKSKKSKGDYKVENKKHQIELDNLKIRSFFGREKNALELLQSDFPSNRPQQLTENVSLLESNPALYMLVIFFSVVIPGLCIGYKL